MLLKSADDKSKRLKLLKELQKSIQLTSRQKEWLRHELQICKKGIEGERDAAHYLNSQFSQSENHVLLHDLRFEIDGEVAQIDHLMINRASNVFLIETKNYAGHLIVNEQGEFTVQYGDELWGIASPLEQSRRHERLLSTLCERLEITGRVDKHLAFHHVVLMHPKAIIKRPDPKVFDTSFLIKADQFLTWHKKFVDEIGAGTLVKSIFNLRSQETIAAWGEKLKRCHRPADMLSLPPIMKPTSPPARVTSAAVLAPIPTPAPAPGLGEPGMQRPTATPIQKTLICADCGAKISLAEGRFCWNQPQRFHGLQYCRAHQAAHQPGALSRT